MVNKNFDKLSSVTSADGVRVEYGIIEGNSQVVFIKAGAGGTYLGDEEKYLRMARLLNEKSGCTVICASNPDRESFNQCDFRMLTEYIQACLSDEASMYFIGSSNGAYQGLVFATRYFRFKRMLLINMPLMLNYHKSKAALDALDDTEVDFVYGEHDPSFSYLPFLKSRYKDRFRITVIEGANHNFTGMLDDFIALANMLR